MTERIDPREADADERRFALSVWPRTPERPWHAEVSACGAAPPMRFERPVDLVLFLTELSCTPDWRPRGLR